jgi:hypothetical protein
MADNRINCPSCQTALPVDFFNRPDFSPCPTCGRPLQIEVFPAFFRPVVTGRAGEAIMQEGEAGCFYHPEKKAVAPCDVCGRFLCALCDCDLDGRHVCPSCLETGRQKGKIEELTNRRTQYDRIALTLALVPFTMIGFCATIVTAPAAVYIAIRHWNTPGGIVGRSRARFVVAIILALLSLLLWFAWIGMILYFNPRSSNSTHGH